MRTAWKTIPTLSRTCAHCCSGLSAAHGSADQWRILVGPDAHKIDEPSAGCPSAPTMSISSSSSRARSAGACLPDIAPTLLSPTGGEGGEGALFGSKPESTGGTHDRICWDEPGMHRRRQRNGPRLGPPAGGGSLQCRNVRRLADRLGGNAKALRGGGGSARDWGPAPHRRC